MTKRERRTIMRSQASSEIGFIIVVGAVSALGLAIITLLVMHG